MKRKLLIPAFLVAMATPLLFSPKIMQANAQFIFDFAYSDTAGYIKHATQINGQLADEGFVLLKNKDNFLPMNTGAKVSLVGKASGSSNGGILRGGTGSGAGSVASGVTSYDWQKSLKDEGFVINDSLTSFYNGSSSGSGRTSGNSGWKGVSQVTIGETPQSSYSQTLIDSLDQYNDAIIMVIAREGSEGCDVKTYDARDNNNAAFSRKHALELSDNEQALFDIIKQHTDHVIIVLNSCNIFECDKFENDPKVSAVIWAGTVGDVGAGALGRIMSGKVNPSGHTVSTWTRDFTKDPTWQNFSDNGQTNLTKGLNGADIYAPQDTMINPDGTPVNAYGSYKNEAFWDDWTNGTPSGCDADPYKYIADNHVAVYGLNGVRPSSYINYEEGIYLDYRYYETRYADMAKESQEAADTWYDGEEGVVYPFGYGLSYTTFTQEIVDFNYDNSTISNGLEKFNVQVKVTNTGNKAGKDVVQLYWKAPYKAGGIEKADRVLCAFDKTKLLAPNESETITLSVYAQDFANYDFDDKNANGFKGYELDPGKYELSVNKNAHEEFDHVTFKVDEGGIKFKTDRYTGVEVKNRFSGQDFYSSMPLENDVEFTQMSREDFEGTFPHFPTVEDRTLKEGSSALEFYSHPFSIKDIEIDHDYSQIPEAAYKTLEDLEELGWEQAKSTMAQADRIQFEEMIGVSMDDPKWTEFLNQFTFAELEKFVYGGNDHNPAISQIGKPNTGDSDGPVRFRTIFWVGCPIVAASYNVDLSYERGRCVGFEAHNSSNTYGWAGPAVNMHRSPFGGRNFEYYSADPFLSGKIGGRVVAGASDEGVYCFFKHFAVNDQEKHREGVTIYLTEQALREIYLKPFQMCVQEGRSMGLMSSYNRIGLMETAASYPLLTEVLREEWGFTGTIISDMTHRGNSAFNAKYYENINNRILAGDSNQLDGQNYKPDAECTWDADANGGNGAPVFTYEGEKYESYSWWYAVRKMAQESLWACANCGAMRRTFIASASELEFVGAVRNTYEFRAGQNIDIEIDASAYDVGQKYNEKTITASSVEIDVDTNLPEGLTLTADHHIVGKVDGGFNRFVHVLVYLTLEGETKEIAIGKTMELVIMAPQDIVTKKANNILPIVLIAGGVALVAVAACVTVVLLKRKKKVA